MSNNLEEITLATRLAERLRKEFPQQTEAMLEQELSQIVCAGIKAARDVDIKPVEDIFRFIALRFLLTPEQQKSPLISSVAIRILDHTEWEGTKRMNFIYKHLINRKPSSAETDISPFFILKPKGENNKK